MTPDGLPDQADYTQHLLSARTAWLDLEAVTTKRLQQAYDDAGADLLKRIQALNGPVRRAHLEALRTVIQQRRKTLDDATALAIRAGITTVTGKAWDAAAQGPGSVLAAVFGQEPVRRAFRTGAERQTLAFLTRATQGLHLSDRVYRTSTGWEDAMVKLLSNAVATGKPARELAQDVAPILQSGAKTPHRLATARRLGVPANLPYAAMRLARTEMQNAFHEGSILANQAAPSYRGITWRLSSRHPETDVCNDYAEHDGTGFWPVGEEPTKPHPQCFCVALPRHEHPDAMLAKLEQWLDKPSAQPGLETWYQDTMAPILQEMRQARPTKPRRGVKSQLPDGPAATPAPFTQPLTPEAQLRHNVRTAEDRIRLNQTFETLVAFDPAGTALVSKPGDRYSVSVSDAELADWQRRGNVTVTHNHPRGWEAPESSPMRQGNSFSQADIYLAAEANLAEMRAVTPLWRYSMKPGPHGWLGKAARLSNLKTFVEGQFNEQRAAWGALIQQGKMTVDQANAEAFHDLWTRVIQQTGWEYTREPYAPET